MTLALKNKPLQLVVLTLILLSCLALFLRYSYNRARLAYIDQQVDMLAAIADIHAREIGILLQAYVEKVGLVASRTRLRKLLAQIHAEPSPGKATEMSRILRDAASGDADLDLIVVYDASGMPVASTANSPRPKTSTNEFVASGLGRDRFAAPFVQSRFEQDELRLEIFAPMRLDDRLIGVMQARLTPNAINRAIRGTTFGETGEVVLGLRLESGETHLIARLGAGGEGRARRAPMEFTPEVAMHQALARKDTVLLEGIDRDLSPVVAVTRYLEGPGWGLVAKVDIAEVERALVEIRNDFVFAACLLFVPGLGISLYFSYQLDRAQRKLENDRHSASLEQADRRFRSVFTHSPVAMLMVRADGTIELANEEAENLLEYEPGELNGRAVDELVPDEIRARHADWREQFKGSRRSQAHYTMAANRDLTAKTRNGNSIPVTIGLTPVATEQGPMVVAAISDLTERQAAHERISAHAEALQRSNEELDRFAYVASHDLKAPLQGIAQLARMIEEDVGETLPEESRDDLRLMQGRVSRLKRLLDSLLQYSRIGRLESEPEVVMPAEVLDELAGLLLVDGAGRIEYDANLPPVYAPRTAIELIFRNLIANSIKHHDRGSVQVRVGAERLAERVIFEFSDDGPGIAPEYGERIFELFQTLKRRDEVEGSGMGLALVRKAVDNLGGRIELQARSGRGACFRLDLPAAEIESPRLRA